MAEISVIKNENQYVSQLELHFLIYYILVIFNLKLK
jgi:hypothetical protein